jgi:hypothetical protein
MSGTEIILQYPVQGPTGLVEKVTLRRAKVRDQIAAQEPGGNPAAQEMRLFGFLTGQPPEVLEEMDYADYLTLQKAFTGFLPPRTKEA